MKLTLLITPESLGSVRLQSVLEDKRDALAKQGVAVSQALGKKNATRLWMAVTDPAAPDHLRTARGFARPEAQKLLASSVRHALVAEAAKLRPDTLLIACSQLVGLGGAADLARLADLLAPLEAESVEAVLHVEDQARVLARHYAAQVFEGRHAGLGPEMALAAQGDWFAGALAAMPQPEPRLNRFAQIHAPAPWLDYTALKTHWETAFGPGSLRLRPHDAALLASPAAPREIEAMLGAEKLGKTAAEPLPEPPSEAFLDRARAVNALFERVLATGRIIPRLLWRRMLGELSVPGDPLAPGALAAVSRHFAAANAALVAANPALAAALAADPPLPDWQERPPEPSFRASQYLAVFMPRIDKATAEAIKAAQEKSAKRPARAGPARLSPEAEKLLPPLAKATFAEMSNGRYAPHNRIGKIDEETPGAPYQPMAPRQLPRGSTGNVIVACMKNEGPYIVEWVAYHRAIGVDNFIIYTNGCDDGTDEILQRLQALGAVQHRSNDAWKGKSPQQAALNKSLKEPLVRNADWLIHIDVDEFMNIRTGNGTLPELLAAMPGATNIAMTWRLFGHGGVAEFRDEPVIGQFTRCAPAYCPKPHTVWGFKTMFRNIGAYAKMSCHRPNKLVPAKRDEVAWFNGSGEPMAEGLKDRGWRSGLQDIGYDLIQLNHYALRSAESFLVKRQRGRALHVDRSIGLNYWIRMDWDDATDVTIQRNLPRLRAEMDRLFADADLKALHRRAVDWHRTRTAELHATPEFEELFHQALTTRLSGMERVAYALALDLEN